MTVKLLSTESAGSELPRPDRPDPAGVVRRGAATEHIAGYTRTIGEAPPCFSGVHAAGNVALPACERPAVMEVYGLMFCEVHGEEAAAGALEEIAYDLEQELGRLSNPYVRPLSPHLIAALRHGDEILGDEGKNAEGTLMR